MSHPPGPGAPQESSPQRPASAHQAPQQPEYPYDASPQAGPGEPLPGPTALPAPQQKPLQAGPMPPQAVHVPPPVQSASPQAWQMLPSARDLRPEHFPTTVGKDGRVAWSLGLVGLIGFPGLAIIAASLAMLIAGLLQRRKNPVARSVGTRAAIFGAVSLLVTILFFTFLFGILLPLVDAGVVADNAVWPAFIMVPLGVWVVIAGPITAIVMGIVGLAKPVGREKAERLYARASR